LDSEQYRSRQVEQRNRPAMLADELSPFREGQCEVQKQRRLQQPRDFIGPQDDPVKTNEPTGVAERVENERYQAENIEMRGTDRRPTPQQYIKPNAQVNERDQPRAPVHRAFGWNQ